jgi:hypothetical protein
MHLNQTQPSIPNPSPVCLACLDGSERMAKSILSDQLLQPTVVDRTMIDLVPTSLAALNPLPDALRMTFTGDVRRLDSVSDLVRPPQFVDLRPESLCIAPEDVRARVEMYWRSSSV